jgi:hypothetical protein
MGYGPFDYHALMQINETPDNSGKRQHPLLQGIVFEARDIAPDFVTRDALNEIALALKKNTAATGEAVRFTQPPAGGQSSASGSRKKLNS